MHKNSKELFNKYALGYFKPGMKVFEIGPERQAYVKQNLDNHLNNEYDYYYTDLDKEHLKKVVNDFWGIRSTFIDTPEMPNFIPMLGENEFGCEDNKFDIVFSTNVIEHVRMPWVWLKEITRIVKPGGHVITVCPGITTPYHEDPIDCWRIWPEGFNSLYNFVGLTDVVGTFEHVVPEPDGYKHLDTIAIGIKPQ
jgi:SAM-dependent methyltransferase